MQKYPTLKSIQGKSGNNFNQPTNVDSKKYIVPVNSNVKKDKYAEELPGTHHIHGADASKPRNVTVNYKF